MNPSELRNTRLLESVAPQALESCTTMMTPEDKQALDIVATSPDGATEQILRLQGISRAVLDRLAFAGYVRQATDLFTRSREVTAIRFYLTAAGRKARGIPR